ncbi:hypothetical protein AVEN_7672-1, partial [Araneus ventricosus]
STAILVWTSKRLRSNDKKTPELALPLQTCAPHQRENLWPPKSDLTCNMPIYKANLPWNRVSNLGPSGSETLPLGHHGPSPFPNCRVHINVGRQT